MLSRSDDKTQEVRIQRRSSDGSAQGDPSQVTKKSSAEFSRRSVQQVIIGCLPKSESGAFGDIQPPAARTSNLFGTFKHALVIWLGVTITIMPLMLFCYCWPYWYLWPVLLYTSVMPLVWMSIAVPWFLVFRLCLLLRCVKGQDNCFTRFTANFLVKPYMSFFHGYEAKGLEHLPPDDQAALIVYYHGVLPVDILFLGVLIFTKSGRVIGGIAHRCFFRAPIIAPVLRALGFSAEGREQMISALKDGSLLTVAPGGVYEAMFSTNYSVEFRNRQGFAFVAKEAGVPIIPMFTENLREHLRMHFFGFRELMEAVYNAYRYPMIWACGGMPVKLRSHLGSPIHCGKDESAAEFAERVKKAIEDLRDTHQKRDNSILRALRERCEEASGGTSVSVEEVVSSA